MIMNETRPLRTTLEEIIYWKETPVNIDRVDTVPLIEAFRDIVPKGHLIRKASLPLCCKTTFISFMGRPIVGTNRRMTLAASSEHTPLLFGKIFKEELKQTRSRFTDGSKLAEGTFGGFSTTMRTKAGATGRYKAPPYLPWRPWPSPSLSPVSRQGHNFSIICDSMSVATAISSSKTLQKDPHSFPALRNSLRRQRQQGNTLGYIGSQPVKGLPGTRKPTN
jgi:hypothetical protein